MSSARCGRRSATRARRCSSVRTYSGSWAPGASTTGAASSCSGTAPSDCAVGAAREHLEAARYVVASLVLLRSDATRATVVAEVSTPAGAQLPAHWCGPIELQRSGPGWRVTATTGLREVGPRDLCLPRAPRTPRG